MRTKAEFPAIPWVDAEASESADLVRAFPERTAELIGGARSQYGSLVLRAGDALSRRWLERTGNPFRREIATVADVVGAPGGFMLNLSFEWSCTSAVALAGDDGAPRLLRTLDWPQAGLGRTVVVARRSGPAGVYDDITWPGMVGVLTATAPGRFAASINQPPMRRRSPAMPLDWLIERFGVWGRNALPPTHLLRSVFENCSDYSEARTRLIETPVAIPVFFTLAGVGENEGCVIERTETEAFVHEGPAAIANHWLGPNIPGRQRGIDSAARLARMNETMRDVAPDLAWVVPPLWVRDTRLGVDACPRAGELRVRGYERDGPATALFDNRRDSMFPLGDNSAHA